MRGLASLALVVLASSIALADSKSPPAAAKPPAETDELAKALSGTWKCSGKAGDGMNVEVQFAIKLTIGRTLDGQWIQMTGKAMDGNQHATSVAFTGYVPAENKYYRYTVSSDGTYATQTATMDRAMGDTWGMQWTGDTRNVATSMLHTNQMRETEKFSAGVLERTGEMSLDGKAWTKVYAMSCKK